MTLADVPKYDAYVNPILQALKELGGSAGLRELDDRTAKIMCVPEETLAIPHVRRRGQTDAIVTTSSEFSYRLRWALTSLKKAGLLSNSVRGIWAFTDAGKQAGIVNEKAVIETGRRGTIEIDVDGVETEIAESDENGSWSDTLLKIVLELQPEAFERLAQRLLREAGFERVQVTGRTGDGGIDGFGVLRLNDLVTMSAAFQCKRYRDNVGAPDIRDFRGGLAGRADRGIFVTSSGFTPAAIREAVRDGAVPIDLIDGARLVHLLKRFRLGVEVTMVEEIAIQREWFQGL